MSLFRNTEPSLIERIVLKALSKMTFTTNGLRVDGSNTVQPVSGTVTANIGTGTLAGGTNLALGRSSVDGQSVQQSYAAFQSGFRRNIIVS